ncbi:SDR family oxidoreductase [Pelagicoccus sp. SDUM812002]|uniref:SDR family oxidoreductase n=1 Tax=Pelagicoccus sp. SDUM812002 TaxID=3041266 RepID=UPI00280FF76B|nr:SDR family oxidoreductase [Pelagicoccus sp. SDUM812002]MDQ8185116.1 SDR family oxidoreductase [Pelagicoccus sp. SDUM812002]
MKVLFVGGTGIISTACVELAVARGHAVTVLNRGNRSAPEGARSIVGDINDLDTISSALGSEKWDSIVDVTAFIPQEVERRIALFSGKTDQYVFISSASAYQKPVTHYLITEETPLDNPFWQYSRDKARCEKILLDANQSGQLPCTIIRPSLSYGSKHVPLVMNSWHKPYTIVDRMRRGLPLVVPGDGTSLWTITHSSDFAIGLVGLLGNTQAVGEAFHITSDEVQTWDQYAFQTAAAAGVPMPDLVHIASDFIAACMPDCLGSLLGDKSVSVVFDNSKIKRFVPDFKATVSFAGGIRKSIENMDADDSLRAIDDDHNLEIDRLIAAYRSGLEAAKPQFAPSR